MNSYPWPKSGIPNALEVLQWISEAAAANDIPITHLCREAGVHYTMLSRWKAGTHEPRLSLLVKLDDALRRMMIARMASL